MPDLKVTDDSPQRVAYVNDNSPETSVYTLPRVAGSSGQVITIDANGDCNFQNVGSIGALGSIEFRALPYYDEAGAAGSNSPADLWDPTGKSITPEVYFNLSQVSYSATPTSNTWRYKNGWNGGLTFTGGTQNTGVTQPALEFATYDGTTLNPQVTGSFIYRDAGGTDYEFAFTVNWILIQEGAAGSDGAVGISARAVNLTATDQTIEYDTDGTNPNPSSVTITATAVNASESEDVYFEFFVNDENQDVSPAAAGDNSPFTNSFTLTSDATIGNPKKIEVQIREGSLSNPILARDQMTIFGLKQGSDAITISFTNDSHVLPTTSNGTVDYSNSGTDIEVFEGTNQLVYDEDSPHALSSYRVTAVGSNVDVDSSPTFDSEFLTSPLSLYSPEVGYVRRYGEVHNMSADSASIEFTITTRDSEGKERIFTKKQSLAKSVQGGEGAAGSDGRTVTLTAGDQIFEYATNGADPQGKNSGNNQTTITAEARNTTGTLYYEFFVDDSSVQLGSSNTYDYTAQTDIANMPDKIEVELREGGDSPPNVVARDQFTIFGVQQGTDAVTIAIDNEAHTVSTNSAGDSPDIYVGSGTNIDVFEGATHLSYDNSPTYDNSSYRISATSSDITIGSASTSDGTDGGTSGKTRIIGDHSSMSGADDKIIYSITVKRADSTEQTFTRTQSISKSADGEAGADAKTVRLTAADYVIEYDQSGKNPNVSGDSPSEEIVLTATAQNFTDPYFKFTGDITEETSYTNGTLNDDADTFTFSVPADYSSTPKVIRVSVSEAAASGTEVAFDSITIASVKEGSGAIFVQLTNDSHVFPADSDGAVTDFNGSGTNIEVYEGATQLDYDGSGTTAGHFTVTTDGGTNITPGGITDSGNVAVVADASTGVANNVNTSKIVFTISGKRGNGDAFSITKNQTFSKGTTGATGTTGSRTVKGILYYEYATEAGTCGSGDTTTMTHSIRAADWSDDEYNTGFEIVNLTQSLNADITDVNGSTGVITHASITAWNDGVDQYVIRPLPDQDSNATYYFTATGDSALSGVASNWSVEPPEVQLSKSYQRYWEVEFSATETGVTGSGPITFGTPVPSIRFGVNIQSDNFQAGLEGWQIQRDSGDAEFNNIIARGSLKGGKTGPKDYLAFQSPNDDSPAPFDADGIDSPPNRVHTGFYIGPDDRSPTSYDFIIGDDEHQLRFDGSKGRLDLKGVNNLGVAGTFEAKGNSSLSGVVIYDFANETTAIANETNVSVRMYAGTLDAAANNSRVAHIVTRTGAGGFDGSPPYNTDGRYEIKDANAGEMNFGAILTFEQFKFRPDATSGDTFLDIEADGDAHFYGNVNLDAGLGSLSGGSYDYGSSGYVPTADGSGGWSWAAQTGSGTSDNATNAAHVLVTDNESTNEENLITFVEDATSSTGNVGLEMDGNFSYNPSTGTVSATIFKGNIDAVDGDFDGTLETDALSINGTSVTSTAAELNLLDGSTANTVVNSKAVIYGSGGQLAATTATIDRGTVSGNAIPLIVKAAANGANNTDGGGVVVEHRNTSTVSADTNVTHRYAAGPDDNSPDDAEVNLITTHDYNTANGTFEIKGIRNVDAGIVFSFDTVKFRNDALTTTFLDIEADGDAYFYNRVGIGRSPTGSYKLDVDGDINFTGNLTQNGSTYGGGSGSGTVTGTGTANRIAKWSGESALTDSLVSDDGTTVSIAANDFTVDTDTLFVDASADRVGIGTSTPGYKLEVNGDTVIGDDTTGNARINSISGDSTYGSGNVHYTFKGNEGTGMRRASANTLTFDTASNERLRIDSSGNVGIGTTPSYKLDVSGTGRFTGALTTSGGIDGLTLSNGISGNNFNISGVNQLSINDPGEGIVFGGGTTTVTLAAIDDSTDSIMNFDNATELRRDGNKVWDAGNDGTGSGLDADLLDGIDSGSFLRSDAADSASGSIDFTGDVDFTNYLRTDEIRAYSGQDLTITAGESSGSLNKSSFNDEIIRLAGEGGVKVYASSDNLSSGLDKETILINTAGDMYVDRRLYIGNSSSYFFTDTSTRTAYTGGDFYIQSGVTNYYNFAINQYIGNTSGNNIYFRGNPLSGDTWKIEADGDFGIGTTSPSYKLDVNGSGRFTGLLSLGTNDTTVGNLTMYSSSSGSEGPQISMHVANTLGTGGSGNVDQWNIDVKNDDLRIFFDAIGFITMAGHQTVRANRSFTVEGAINSYEDITAFYSDERLKTRDGIIENPIEKVKSLTGFYFRGNEQAGKLGYDTEKRQVGLSAQEVEKVLPEVIKPAPVDNKYKTLDYAKIVPLLVEAIKEQQEQIENLQKKLEEMSK